MRDIIIFKGGDNDVLFLLAYLQGDPDALVSQGVWRHSLLPTQGCVSVVLCELCGSLKTRHLPLLSLETFSPEVSPWVER